jgi:hypothetical protein
MNKPEIREYQQVSHDKRNTRIKNMPLTTDNSSKNFQNTFRHTVEPAAHAVLSNITPLKIPKAQATRTALPYIEGKYTATGRALFQWRHGTDTPAPGIKAAH